MVAFPDLVELVRLVVKLEVPVDGPRVVVMLVGTAVVPVLLNAEVELVVVEGFMEVAVAVDSMLVEGIEVPLPPVPEVGKLKV